MTVPEVCIAVSIGVDCTITIFFYNEHNNMYCNVAWEEMAVDEVSEDPEHEHRLFMFHSQDPGFHDVYLGVPTTTTISDYSDSDTGPHVILRRLYSETGDIR